MDDIKILEQYSCRVTFKNTHFIQEYSSLADLRLRLGCPWHIWRLLLSAYVFIDVVGQLGV
jgi:hypothetical protein